MEKMLLDAGVNEAKRYPETGVRNEEKNMGGLSSDESILRGEYFGVWLQL